MKLWVGVLLLLLGEIASAQYDPGIRDSVSFGPWEAIVPADSPWSGNIRVPVNIFHDEFLSLISLVFEHTGPWQLTGVSVTGIWTKYMGYHVEIDPDTPGDPLVLIFAITAGSSPTPPASGLFAYLCFEVKDTGNATIDAGYTVLQYITHFYDGRNAIDPDFTKLQDAIQATDFPAGDVNADSVLSLADIVALANYVLRFGNKPPIINLCDVNADCKVNLVDVVYLVNVILRGRFVATYGCVC